MCNCLGVVFAAVSAASFSLYQLGTAVFCAKTFSFCLDSRLSFPMQEAIKSAVHQTGIVSLPDLAACVQKVCLFVASVAVQRSACNVLKVSCTVHAPALCLADHSVMVANGSVADRSAFGAEALNDIPVIYGLSRYTTPSSAFTQWILGLDHEVFDAYRITWADDYEIYLHDKQDEQKKIICSVANRVTQGVREQCRQIIQEKQTVVHGTAHRAPYTADIRFEKQIVICSHAGGVYHG